MPPKRRNQHENISTHAPLAGRDAAASSLLPFFFDFNPRAPCGARRQALPRVLGGEGFQPTRPLRGATPGRARSGSRKCQFQPTRPLRGATRLCRCTTSRRSGFQPTRPLRGATLAEDRVGHGESISTHAPLAGRDAQKKNAPTVARHFNPRAPCGARQQKCTNHYAHFCDNRQISDAFAQNAACQSILLLFDAGKPCGFGCEPPK